MKTINFSISYGNFCMCPTHFASHYISWKVGSESNGVLEMFILNNTLVTISFQKKTTQHLSSARNFAISEN